MKNTILCLSFMIFAALPIREIFPESNDGLVKALEQSAASGNLNGMEIEYYVHGGLPPPYYVSEQFRVLPLEGEPSFDFSTLKFDKKYTPPDLTEKFRLPAKASDIQKLVQTLLDSHVFTSPNEKKTDTADRLSHEIIITWNNKEYKKVYNRALPEKLSAVQSELNRLIELTKANGKMSVLHEGIPLSLDPLKKVADAEALRQGFDLQKMEVKVDEENSQWKKYSAMSPHPDLEAKLKGKDFIAVYYSPKADKTVLLGGDLWVLVDRKDSQVITVLRGK